MAQPIRFTQAEREWLRGWLEPAVTADREAGKRRDAATGQRVLDKLEKSELVKKHAVPSMPWRDGVRAMEEVAGKVALPPGITDQWAGWMQSVIRKYGLTEEHCRQLASYAVSRGWRPVNFEFLIKNAIRYLNDDGTQSGARGTQKGAPVDMEDL